MNEKDTTILLSIFFHTIFIVAANRQTQGDCP